MKSTKFITVLMIAVSLLIFTSCGRHIAQSKPPKQEIYLCPMHKEYISSQPGKCPKCGMELISFDDYRKSVKDRPVQNSVPDSHSGMGGGVGGHTGHH